MAARTPYQQEMKERAVRMVGEIRENYGNEYAAIRAVRLGIGSPESGPRARPGVMPFSIALNPSPGLARAWPLPADCLALAADS